jgi:uncharacterized protein YbjT (DUF2867 family)
MSSDDRVILVTGATGKQGGAVAKHLLAQGWRVRALVRDPNSPAAKALAARGVELARGDLEDRASLEAAVRGAYGVFSVQTFMGPEGPAGETRQGQLLADVAKAAGVQHFVYSSVGGAERHTGVPHFESKWQIEEHIRALGLPATIFRPVYFMENLRAPWSAPRDGVLAVGLRPTTRLQMLGVDDIGAFVALAFARPQEFSGKEIELASDALTMPEVADAFTRVTGQPVRFVEVPIEQVRSASPELAKMYAWFNDHGYDADIERLRGLYPGLTNFETWLRQTG